MLREEAIMVLKNEQPHCGKKALFPEEKKYEAYDVAIKALEQEPCDDCVRRQAVLDILKDEWNTCLDADDAMQESIDTIEALNPVTPQSKNIDIAKAFQLGLAFGFGEKYDEMDKVMEEVKKAVTPQPKMGCWIEHFDESGKWYECDQCHTDWGGPVNYCPNCGAKMERSDKE